MAHDVFISHSAKDKVTGDAVCAMLESDGIRCWIAPRDVTPGMEWGECIIQAIKNSRIMVLVFSTHANESPQIRREIERAVNHGVAILPLRIEDVQPGMALEYFIGNVHWLDALTPPLESHLKNLAGTVKVLLERMGPRDAGPMPGTAIEPPSTVAPIKTPTPSIQTTAPITQTDTPPKPAPAGFAVVEKVEVPPAPATRTEPAPEPVKPAPQELITAKAEKPPETPQEKTGRRWKSGILGGEQAAEKAKVKPDEATSGIFHSVVGSQAPSRQINQRRLWIGFGGVGVLALGIMAVSGYFESKDPANELAKGYAYWAKGQNTDAFEMFRRSAEQGNDDAAERLGFMYYEGQGTTSDYTQAAKWLRVPAEKGSTRAMATLGYLYSSGLGVTKNYPEALTWFRKGAEQSDALSEYFLGKAYEFGMGVTKDNVTACVWYIGASKHGNAEADDRLKHLETRMTPAEVNEVKHKADDRIAENTRVTSDGDEEYRLGVMYDNDHFYADALKWYRKAADGGDVEAEVNIGRLYESGQGVPRDFAQAFAWWRKAAERGNADAEYDLATLYENGQGVPRDVAQARIWYQKAADGGDDDARKRLAELDRQH